MLCVLAVLGYLYLSAGLRLLSTIHQSHRDRGSVAVLMREHDELLSEREALGRRGTLEAEARRLGLAGPREQQYIVSGLPGN